jgi:alcohol dehydrogenase (NADP+)
MKSGSPPEVWNDMHGKGDVLLSCSQSLRDLGLDYLDLFLVHWPFPNHHPPGCDVNERNPHAKPYIHEDFMKTWNQMERLVDMGLVRHIGTSNMTIPKLEMVLRDCRIKPACNEMELHPHFQQPEFFDYVKSKGIQPIGYSPIGSPGRPERDRTSEDTVDIEDPVIVAAAEKRGVHPALICLKWAVQRGQIPIPFSTKRRNILSNLKAVVEDPLTEAENGGYRRYRSELPAHQRACVFFGKGRRIGRICGIPTAGFPDSIISHQVRFPPSGGA